MLGTGFFVALRLIISNRGLILQLVAREVEKRYRSSALGAFWLVGQPILLLLVYSFVFQTLLRTQWGLTFHDNSAIPFGVIIFSGIILHMVAADTLVRGPDLVLSNSSYVKRVIFPLEILPVVNVLSALVNLGVGLAILLVATFLLSGSVPATALLAPIPIFLFGVLTIGLGWFLSAIGVFFRDLGQFTSTLATIMLFTAPICYPPDIVPQEFRWLLQINPLTVPVEALRAMIFTAKFENWGMLGQYAIVAALVAFAGQWTFNRLRQGFADVI